MQHERRNNFSRNNNSDREEHKAVCDKCGKDCTVPFKPTKGKPVLCRECFSKDKPKRNNFNSNQNRNNFNSNNNRRDFKQMHKAVCDDCGKNCEVPFKPTKGKPILCRECYQNKK